MVHIIWSILYEPYNMIHYILYDHNILYGPYYMNHIILAIILWLAVFIINLLIDFFHLGFLVDSDHHEDEWW